MSFLLQVTVTSKSDCHLRSVISPNYPKTSLHHQATGGIQVFIEKLLVFFHVGKLIVYKLTVNECAVAFVDPFEIIGIGPIGWISDQAVFDGVSVNITAQMQ